MSSGRQGSRCALAAATSGALLVLLAGACADTPPAEATPDAGAGGSSVIPPTVETPLFRSGSRLRAEIDDGGDGAVALIGWHDTELGVACHFQTAADGVSRCLPATGFGIGYLTPGCTEPVAYPSYACGAQLEYAVSVTEAPLEDDETEDCTPRDRHVVFEVGESVEDAVLYDVDSTGGCSTSGWASGLRAVQELPPARFVAGVERVEARGAAVSAVFRDAEDGSTELRSPGDAARESAPCSPQLIDGEDLRCVPAPAAYVATGTWFSDASCGFAAAYATHDACTRPLVALATQPAIGVCEAPTLQVYGAGKKLGPGAIYAAQPGCGPAASLPQGLSFYEVGSLIDADLFPTLLPAEVGSGRLRSAHHGTEDGGDVVTQAEIAVFVDSARGVRCTPQRFGDGSRRCVPTSTPYTQPSGLFADATCGVPLVPLYADATCPLPVPREVIQDASDSCESQITLFELGPRHDASLVYYRDGNGGCFATETFGYDYYPLVAPIDPSTLPLVTRRIE